MAVEEDDGERSPAKLVCEACGHRTRDEKSFAIHQERHRPVDPPAFDPDTGKEISFRCPEGCGRHFTTLVRFRDHVPACDGGSPIEPFIKNLPTGYRGGFAICPECMEPFKDIDKMSFHLERHREVRPILKHRRTGEVLSKPCPKGCRRHFSHWKEYEEHKRLCQGLPPLPSNGFQAVTRNGKNRTRLNRKGQVPGMLRCEECRRDFSKAGPYSIHLRKKHGKAYQPSAGDGSEEPEQGGEERAEEDVSSSQEVNGSSISDLRDKSRDLRRKAAKLDDIANKIERLLKEAEDLV